MGWTGIKGIEKKNGSIDRKATVDKVMELETVDNKWEVVKSSMVGAVYYGAIKKTNKKNNESTVHGVVVLTHINNKEYLNFWYKEMFEDVLPFFYDCPKSILKLLSDTEDSYSLRWRHHCYECAKKRKAIKSFAVGDKIRTKLWSDEEITLTLQIYNSRKTWIDCTNWVKYKTKDVFNYPFEVIEKSQSNVATND